MKKLYIALLLAVVVGAFILTAFSSAHMQSLQGKFLSLVSPFLRAGNVVQQELGSMGQGLKTLDQLEEEKRKLAQQNRELLATNNMLRDIEAENNRLRDALGYRERSVFRLLPAQIISRVASTWWNTVRINRGFEDGVETDQPVLTELGLVGKTTTVTKNEALVVLTTDETCKVAVTIEGSRERGILSGLRVQESGTGGELQLNFLTKNAALVPGMKVYTAGVSNGVFPSGILVGKVKEFRTRALDGQAIVEPAVDLSRTGDVFVVVGAK